ncbi:hypothetical protein UCDDA912_g10653 [Diaporthe ampelina]|uniref:Uncharacterized protein n=1 Tax=Diaporthe ampelina TaxID=1214573 RepID=A0A0G2F5A7_9PEZI|nr:hypothetical protein UCDDA912_g10653 [Diaporthe ampelina]
MATNRGTDWANTQLQNLHLDLKELLTCIENEKSDTTKKGRRKKATGNTMGQALDNVREDLDVIAGHPYKNVHSSANPGGKQIEPEARGPVRRLYTELKRLLEAPDPDTHEKKVEKHLKSLISMLVSSHPEHEHEHEPEPEPEPTAKDSTEEEPATTSSGRVLRDVGQRDMNVDKIFQELLKDVEVAEEKQRVWSPWL